MEANWPEPARTPTVREMPRRARTKPLVLRKRLKICLTAKSVDVSWVNTMKREQLTEKILDVKRQNGWTWKHITDEIAGMSPILVVGALLGQMKLTKPLAERAAALFGLSENEKRMLNEVPTRGT